VLALHVSDTEYVGPRGINAVSICWASSWPCHAVCPVNSPTRRIARVEDIRSQTLRLGSYGGKLWSASPTRRSQETTWWNGRRCRSNLPFINHSGAISQCMDTDAPQPRCPFCGTPVQFKPSVPSFGAHSALQTFDCRGCQVILTVPPGAEVFEMAEH
jgi:hypothetical protein